MKRVIIVHGYGGAPRRNWFPWLKQQLEHMGVTVIAPAMPRTLMPTLSAWLPYLRKTVGNVDEDTYFVGHSLGCPTILRLLESLDEGQKAGGAVLVAGFAEPIHFTELNSFTTQPWDDEHIRAATNKLVLINSDDDPHIPFVMAEHLRDRFHAELVVLPGARHINRKSGFKELPIALEKLTEMFRL